MKPLPPVTLLCDDSDATAFFKFLERLIGKEVLAVACVPLTDAAMIQFDGDTAIYFYAKDNRLAVSIEAPSLQ